MPAFIKRPENIRPRYPEDEGLLVGKRLPVSQTNENILENRILKMEEVISTNLTFQELSKYLFLLFIYLL